MPSRSASSESSSWRRSGWEVIRAVRVMLTMLTRFCEICRARGSTSYARKIPNQAAVVASTSAASRMKVRHRSERGQNLNAMTHSPPRPSLQMSSLHLPVGHEDVAEPPHGLDISGMRGILLDELAQARDLHVDRAVEHLVFAAPRELHQLVARQGRSRVGHQHLEQGELAGGERERLTVVLERARREIHGHVAEADLFGLYG